MHSRTSSIMGRILNAVGAMVLLWGASAILHGEALDEGFADPPDSTRPWAYWWWLDGNASREGITRDLEEMRRQGISGVLLFDAGEGKGSPVGPKFMSDPWRELFKHAVREADRLRIEMGVNLCSGWNAGGTWVTPEHAAKRLVWTATAVQGPGRVTKELSRPQIVGDFYRDTAVIAFPGTGRPAGTPGLKHWEFKAARTFLTVVPETLDEEEAGAVEARDCESEQVVHLSNFVDAQGRLTWDVPAGTWTVLRLGYTLLGARTSCASPGSQGLEIDFFSRAAMEAHWAQTGEKLIADAGPLAGKTFKYVHDDSYEVAGPDRSQQNWTPEFLAEFQARRGYDPRPYLPVLAGMIVDSREVSNRFLWDYRRTIGDLFAAGHYRRMSELAGGRHGLGTHPESGGPFWPYIDALECVGINDIPMGEFWKRVPESGGKVMWADNYPICDTVKQAASAAHIYGKPVCQAEAFTSMGPNWEEDLHDLKDLGDKAFCAGLTRNVLCFYVHQPRLDIRPGYQWEAAGTHFDRNVTWWDCSHAWMTYLSRCQYMLRQGRFAADLLYFSGEDVPGYVPGKAHMRPALPKGYDCDVINSDALLKRLSVKDEWLVLPDGMSYRYLVLPHRASLAMSPTVLKKIRKLVEDGATVIGPGPVRSPGLTDYPNCDEAIKTLTVGLWTVGAAGGAVLDGVARREIRAGRGRVIPKAGIEEVLKSDGLQPDFEYQARAGADLDFIHRTGEGADIYFISNQLDRPEPARCTFRVTGRQPEIWCAVTGERRDATDWRIRDGRTEVPLMFTPRQSLFVVFRRSALPPERRAPNASTLKVAMELHGPWSVSFDSKWGGPEAAVFEKLEDWTTRSEEGIRYYSGKATYRLKFDAPQTVLQSGGRRILLELGVVKNVAQVRLNGADLGVVWTAPWRVDITKTIRPSSNQLAIDIVNLWPNRLIGDARLPVDQRLTLTNVKKFKADSPLMPSGLLGPVTVCTEE